MTDNGDWLYGKITDEALATLRSRVGVLTHEHPLSDPYSQYSIIRYLGSCGDDNPLFWDEGYAAGTMWKGVVAPPRMLIAGSSITPRSVAQPLAKPSFMGEDVLRGVFAMISGTRIVFERPIRIGDRVSAISSPFDVVERQSTMAGRSVELINKIVYSNQNGETIATEYASVIRMERGSARENRKYLDIPEPRYSSDEMAELSKYYQSEASRRRGATPRYWEDTAVGEELTPLAKGPLTITEIAAYFMGRNETYYTNRLKHLELLANPNARLVNVDSNVEDNWVAAHWDGYFATLSGIPRPYDEGPMRYDNMTHLVTDWMGDDAVLKEIAVTLRAPNLVGDLSWCTGKVVGKRVEKGAHLVDLEMRITNQRQEVTTRGSAVVELPRKLGQNN